MPLINLLNCEVSCDHEDVNYVRILVDNKHIKYLDIDPGVYDCEDIVFAPVIEPLLAAALPSGDWKKCQVQKDPASGAPIFKTSDDALQGCETAWHSNKVEYITLELDKDRKFSTNVLRARQPGNDTPLVAKFARFEWEMGYFDKEIRAYGWIEGHGIGPPFVGNITEDGRVVGFLIRLVDGARMAEIDDIDACREALGRLHALGIKHGDVNKHNFLIADGRRG